MFSCKINNKFVGNYGDFASYSFQSSKHITSGEGYSFIKDENLAERVRSSNRDYAGLTSKTAKIDKNTIQHYNYSRHSRMG